MDPFKNSTDERNALGKLILRDTDMVCVYLHIYIHTYVNTYIYRFYQYIGLRTCPSARYIQNKPINWRPAGGPTFDARDTDRWFSHLKTDRTSIKVLGCHFI